MCTKGFRCKTGYYLTRAVSSPTSDLGKEVLPGWLLYHFVRVCAEDLTDNQTGMLISGRGAMNTLWTVCQTQNAYKDTESDSCRLQVCSLLDGKWTSWITGQNVQKVQIFAIFTSYLAGILKLDMPSSLQIPKYKCLYSQCAIITLNQILTLATITVS